MPRPHRYHESPARVALGRAHSRTAAVSGALALALAKNHATINAALVRRWTTELHRTADELDAAVEKLQKEKAHATEGK